MTDGDRPDSSTRQTPQRRAILEVIRDADGPLTVEQIHRRAGRRSRGLGIATVYRNLKRLQDAGEVATVVLPDGEARYEAADLGHHHHFRCRSCRTVFDLEICPLSIPHGTTLPGGFEVEAHEVTLYGTCPRCRPTGSH
jgi:Fur family ferric uptake transcriptional regulator